MHFLEGLGGDELELDRVADRPRHVGGELFCLDGVRETDLRTVLPLTDLATGEAGRLRCRVERRMTRETVKVDGTDRLTRFRERAVEHGVLNARLGELIVVGLVVEAPRQLVGRHPQDIAVENLLIDAAVVEAGGQVVDVTVAIQIRDRPLREQLVGNRNVDGGLYVAPVERPESAGQIGAEFLRRLLGPDAERAAGRVAAERGALRATQHFDAVDVHEFLRQETGRADLPHAVDVSADIRDTANGEARAGRAATATRDHEVGDGLADPFQGIEPAQLEAVARHRDDRNGYLLQILFTPGCRDHDFFEAFLRE